MTMFKKKALTTALVAGLAVLGAADIASAVYVNPDNTGQVLLYPYYTVRNGKSSNGYMTSLSVVNTTNTAKVVKVRFLEAKNSKEVLDFNLFLSPKDVWTAAILPTANGAKVVTNDKSCTYPSALRTAGATGIDFVNYAYSGDGGGDTLDRTREGYVEIIEMGDIIDAGLASTVTHSGGVAPCNETTLGNFDTAAFNGTAATYVTVGSGGLSGSGYLTNVNNGTAYSYAATALDAFTAVEIPTHAGSILPNLADVNPKVASVFHAGAAANYSFVASGRNVDPVSAVLMHDRVINEYSVETATASNTDWVVTFPTKSLLVQSANAIARKPFQNQWSGGSSCDNVGLAFYDREEQFPQGSVKFSPLPPSGQSQLCYEANVLTFNSTTSLLGSVNATNHNVPVIYQAGWLDLTFPRISSQLEAHWIQSDVGPVAGYTIAPASTFNGLPTLGFMANDAANGTLTVGGVSVLSNYGYTVPHKFGTNITTP